MTFYSPFAFLFLITVPLIIILYLLKQRHQEHTVSSLYLWHEVLKDIEANAPWQKLKKNLLMFLQILAMLLLTFALSRPFLNSAGGVAANAVIMLDTSFSMQAADTKPSRFEAAKSRAADVVSNLRPGTLVTLISIGNNAIIEENLSKDKNSLLNKIRQLRVTNGIADFDDASAIMQSILKQYPGTAVYFFGDSEFTIPGADIKSYNYARDGDNYAITLLSHTSSGNSITVLSRIANYTKRDSTIPVSLYVNGRVFDAKNVDAKPEEVVNVYWSSIPANALSIECRIDSPDSLDGDNTAWDAINHFKPGKVLLTGEKNIFLEKIISLTNGIELYKTTAEGKNDLKGYDLYIFDGHLPDKLPQDGNIMVFNPPQNNFFQVGKDINFPAIQKSTHLLFNYVKDYSFSISKTKKMAIPAWGETVLDSREGPLIFAGTQGNRRMLVFGFDLHNSDLAITSSFPILMTNCFEWLIPSKIKNVENVLSGQEIAFNLNPKAELARIKTPSGEIVNLAPPFPAELFNKTGETGVYTLEQITPEGINSYHFTVNAPAEKESNLLSGKISSKGTISKKGTISNQMKKDIPVKTGLNLQGFILWIILVLLTLEWWVYKNDI